MEPNPAGRRRVIEVAARRHASGVGSRLKSRRGSPADGLSMPDRPGDQNAFQLGLRANHNAGGEMPRTREPTFRDLDETETHDLLARNHVGRIAYSFHDRVDIEPISYVFADGAIYLRTTPGSKLETLAHSPWVAFEVDEVSGPFDWKSAVAHGTIYTLHDAGGEIDERRIVSRSTGSARLFRPRSRHAIQLRRAELSSSCTSRA